MKKRSKYIKKNRKRICRYGFTYLSFEQMLYSGAGQAMCMGSFRLRFAAESRYFPAAPKLPDPL